MAVKKKISAVNDAEKKENRFSKQQLLESELFRDRRDILETLLVDEKQYKISEVKELMEKYMKGKVK